MARQDHFLKRAFSFGYGPLLIVPSCIAGLYQPAEK